MYMVNMIRKNFFLTIDQDIFLKQLNKLSVSEHIRRAIDEYIAKHQNVAVVSPTK